MHPISYQQSLFLFKSFFKFLSLSLPEFFVSGNIVTSMFDGSARVKYI